MDADRERLHLVTDGERITACGPSRAGLRATGDVWKVNCPRCLSTPTALALRGATCAACHRLKEDARGCVCSPADVVWAEKMHRFRADFERIRPEVKALGFDLLGEADDTWRARGPKGLIKAPTATQLLQKLRGIHEQTEPSQRAFPW